MLPIQTYEFACYQMTDTVNTTEQAPIAQAAPATEVTEAPVAQSDTQPKKRGRKPKPVDPNAVVKPKRKCSEKQLAALAAGRAKNPRFKTSSA